MTQANYNHIYSTPYAVTVAKEHIAVDVKNILDDLKEREEGYAIYRLFPLKDIVTTVLSTKIDSDFDDSLSMELGRRFDDYNLTADEIENITLWCYLATEIIDKGVQESVGFNFDLTDFIFHKWIDSTSVLMVR